MGGWGGNLEKWGINSLCFKDYSYNYSKIVFTIEMCKVIQIRIARLDVESHSQCNLILLVTILLNGSSRKSFFFVKLFLVTSLIGQS